MTEDIISRDRRRVIWRDLGRKSGLEFPKLFAPTNLPFVCMVVYFVFFLAVFFLSSIIPFLEHMIWILSLPGSLLTIIIMVWLDNRLASSIPDCCATVGGLAKAIKAYNLPKLGEGHLAENDVLETISTLMACGFNVGYDEVDVPADTELSCLEFVIVKKRKNSCQD